MSEGPEHRYDVAIVGASLAGSVAATLYGRRGLKVALIERHSDADAFKRVCTHLIQPSATPMMRRHGLDSLIEGAGGIRYRLKIWTRWGWIAPPQFENPQTASEYGYNIRREVLDPLVRKQAASTPGVELMLGHTAQELILEDGRVTGLTVRDLQDNEVHIRANLVVGADGRNSGIAEMAGVGAWTLPNKRVAYGAYYRNLPQPVGEDAAIWFLEPDIAYAFPTDDGQTILATMFPREKLPRLKAALHNDFTSIFEGVPDFPGFEGAEMVGNVIGMASMPNQWRKRPPGGLAFVGDAAVSADPLFGVGCGWALQAAEWLVDATAEAAGSGDSLDQAVARYRSLLRKGTWGHFLITSDYSRARHFNPGELALFSGATRNEEVARRFGELGTRSAPARGFFSPVLMSRAILTNLRHRGRTPAPRGLGEGVRRELEVNGVNTPYMEAGPAGSDEAVVFVHGNPGSADDWNELIEGAGQFARAVAFDLPGFGLADKPSDFDYSVPGIARHIGATLDKLGIRRAHLVVHDFGGPFALQWAADHPDAVASVTLINSGLPQGYRWHYLAKIWRTPVGGEVFQAAANRAAFRLILKHGNRRGLPKFFVDRMYDQYDKGTKRAVLRLYRATNPGIGERLVEKFRALDLPALVIWGAQDPYIPVDQAEKQRNAFPGARVEILPDSGHWPQADNPKETNKLVLDFLAEQLRTGRELTAAG